MISLGYDEDIEGGGQVVGSSHDEPLAMPQNDVVEDPYPSEVCNFYTCFVGLINKNIWCGAVCYTFCCLRFSFVEVDNIYEACIFRKLLFQNDYGAQIRLQNENRKTKGRRIPPTIPTEANFVDKQKIAGVTASSLMFFLFLALYFARMKCNE